MTRVVGRVSSRPLVGLAITISSLFGSVVASSCSLSESGSDTTLEGVDGSDPPVTAGPQADIDVAPVVQGTYIWRAMPVGAGGYVTGIVATAASPAAMYARTDVGGAYRWEPASQQWTQLLDATSLPGARPGDVLSVDSIAVAPSLGSRVYLALGNDENPAPDTPVAGAGRILVSDDSGATWRAADQRWFISGNQRFRAGSERLVVDPANPDHVLFGSSREGLFQSFDAGATWAPIPTSMVPAGIIDDPASDQPGVSAVAFVGTTMFAAVAGSGMYMSSDNGASWTMVRPFDAAQYGAGAIEVAGDLWLAINRTDGLPADLSVFDLDAASWTDLPIPSTSLVAVFAVDPTDASRVALADEAVRNGHIWTSTDGGQSWSAHDIDIASPQIPWLANTDLDDFMSTGRLMFDPVDGSLWFAEGMAVWHSTDPQAATITFTSVARGIEETVASAVMAAPGGVPIGAIADRQGFRFDDTARYPERTLIDDTFVGGTGLDYSGGNPEVVAWVGAEYHIYYSEERRARGALSTDGGITWQQFSGTTPEMFGGEVAVSAVDPDVLVWLPTHFSDPWEYLRSPVGVYYSHDGGQSWTHTDSVAGIDSFHRFLWWFNRRALAADRVNGSFYLMSDEGRFFTSSDGAATWQEAANAPPCLDANACHVLGQLLAQPDRAERLWAGVGIDGLYRTDDAGRTPWSKLTGVDEVRALGFGAPMIAGGAATVFVYGRANGDAKAGLYRSDDDGTTWRLITSFPAGSYTDINAISGDPDVPGRVYIAFSGTGFAQGDPIGATG
ncbi:MAG: hypothetical protein K8R99_01825 [Actinomycetia bacterium]|nr:hypothetical protein [Actinomycetes bacterium]